MVLIRPAQTTCLHVLQHYCLRTLVSLHAVLFEFLLLSLFIVLFDSAGTQRTLEGLQDEVGPGG